ncbi:MAG: glycosyltransferase family 39 protein [Thermodesulfobacterium sp.]|nr:glycosyltransferase family 39 protein [Thermodesulfobacterium sp.]
MNNFFNKKGIFFLLIISFYFLIFSNWSINLTSPDEGKNASVVLNMIKTKDFLVPYYNCNPRFEKPPLLYWAGSVSSLIFGVNEFSLRLVSGLSATGIIIFMYLIATEFFDKNTAWKSILIFLTLPHIWIEARSFTPEMLLNFFSVGSIYFFLKKRPVLGWIFLGLAVLTKGPVGIILPFTVILFFRLTQKNFPVFNPLGIVLFLLVGCSWYFYMLYKFGYLYFYKFFLQENIFRYTGKKLFHPYPFYYYILLILVTSFFFIPIYIKIFTRVKSLYTPSIKPFIFWFLFVLIFYSLSKNKLHHYILFAYPPLCIILANFVSKNYIRNVLIFSGVLLLIIIIVVKHNYEKNRFVGKAKNILESYRGEIYFYKSDISSLPFYLQRCIPKLENPQTIKEGIVVTKRKYEKMFDNCTKIVEAPEFNEHLILLKCSKN